jgi:hypothetical protein
MRHFYGKTRFLYISLLYENPVIQLSARLRLKMNVE